MVGARPPLAACLAFVFSVCATPTEFTEFPEFALQDEAGLALMARCAQEDKADTCSFRQLRGELRSASASSVVGSLTEPENVARLAEIPMIKYPMNYCTHCGEMAFCHRAGNPGCGGNARGGVASFENSKRGTGCNARPTLTVPRSYVEHIDKLRKLPGARGVMESMLMHGFSHYRSRGGQAPVWQCIHKSGSVSVRWLHLHTFCKAGRVDNLPSRQALCALMYSPSDAKKIAARWVH
uniref:Uncharacterized protein n=1 Tax=Pyrodinium bahamense TaxID=73915 RepID=A0A7S0A063_9DINO